MIFTINQEERSILQLISDVGQELGYPVYAVGGYVRDRVLGRPCKDIDIVCVGDGILLAEAVASRLRPRPMVAVFQRFGTAMIKYGDMEIEFVGARKESYNFDSRKPVVSEGTFEDDQSRRDFTINALAVSLNSEDFGRIVDSFGGLDHLSQKLIKTPLDPGQTFSDDPLRMLRAIRFSCQLGFTIDPNTLEGIKRHADRIKIISQERITTELDKIVQSLRPSVGIELLEIVGLLPLIFPEFSALKGVEDNNGISHKDNFYHTLEVLDNIVNVSQDKWLRWAAILHDIAKPPTKRFDPRFGWTFHGHEMLGAKMVPKIFSRFKMPMDQPMRYVQKLVRLHLRPIALTKEEITDSAVRRLIFDAGEDIDDLMQLCKADITSKNEAKVQRYLENYDRLILKIKEIEEKDHLRNWQPPVSGEEIMQIFDLSPSRMVGDIKNAIREAILDGDIPNDRVAALAYMVSKSKELGLEVVDDSLLLVKN